MTINELCNILLSDIPSISLKKNEDTLFCLIPELEKCKGFEQNNEWHIYDVYEHILHVVDNVSSDLVIRLASLFHDIGKPLSYLEDENGVGHFYGHWEVSQEIFELFADKNNLDREMREKISNLIYYHDINVSKLSDVDLNLMIEKLGYDGVIKLYELKRADLLAQNEKFHYILEDYDRQEEELIKFVKCK